MKAIVLTYDRNRIITEHMIMCYKKAWPDNPFIYYIPYQNKSVCNPSNDRVYIQTDSSFRTTVLSLLDNVPDEEWVYWCIDDKYPVKLNREIYQTLMTHMKTIPTNIISISLCRAKKLLLDNFVRPIDFPLLPFPVLQRISLHQIWLHQFIRAKLLRRIFLGVPLLIEKPTDLVQYLHKTALFKEEILLVSLKNNIILGESSFNRVLTENCKQSILEMGLPLPSFYDGTLSKQHIIGSMD